MNICVQICIEMFSFVLGVHLGVELLGHMLNLSLTFWRTARPFNKAVPIYIPIGSVYEVSSFFPSPTLIS